MKRIAILILFLLGTYSCVYGQTWSIGAGYVSRRYGASSYYSTGGFLVGGQYEYRFGSSGWSAAAGLEYSAVKDYYDGFDHRIHIPVTAGFGIFSAGNLDVRLYAGPAVAVGIYHLSHSIGGSGIENEYWEETNPLGLMACGGVSFDFSKKIRLRSGYSYTLISKSSSRRFWDVSLFYLF